MTHTQRASERWRESKMMRIERRINRCTETMQRTPKNLLGTVTLYDVFEISESIHFKHDIVVEIVLRKWNDSFILSIKKFSANSCC